LRLGKLASVSRADLDAAILHTRQNSLHGRRTARRIAWGRAGQAATTRARDAKLSEGQRRQRARGYAERAMGLLRQAVAKGYNDAGEIKKDKNLDPLRSRPDFQQLLAEMEHKKTNSGKK
jgi:hypothetical protein